MRSGIIHAVHPSLLVAAGGALGSVLRHAIGVWGAAHLPTAFPWATLGINVAGSLAIGVVMERSATGAVGAETRLFLATGVLGGFTTFSAFSHETLELVRRGAATSALAYALASVVLGLAACWAGVLVTRSLAG